MNIYEIDPTADERWDQFLQKNPQASIFHTRGWMEALRTTYGYTPVAFTTSPPGSPLTNGLPFCRLTGFLGGKRLVSLPFSDHCTPLLEEPGQLNIMLRYLQNKAALDHWQYFELRSADPVLASSTTLTTTSAFFLHKLDLTPSLDKIFENFHKDCVQRKVYRAAREQLIHEEGNSPRLLQYFYHLLLITRCRQGLPAQPSSWFRNLIECLGDNVRIHVTLKDGLPTASIFTLRYKDCLVYKYGCSDRRFSNLGGMQLLFWNVIQAAKEDGVEYLNLGRTDIANAGLIAFKDRLGAERTLMTYQRNSAQTSALYQRRMALGRYVLAHAPTQIIAATGSLFYRYLG